MSHDRLMPDCFFFSEKKKKIFLGFSLSPFHLFFSFCFISCIISCIISLHYYLLHYHFFLHFFFLFCSFNEHVCKFCMNLFVCFF
ncbi:hypothetical protein RhiirA1_217056 [Rhizophagus irregularis]|uniref:Uncharacterized protein n=1 Tax=Rhizophagus irregularis TaxID=588596 RepID=A0A2N0RMT0_9GLOM|nr:hypothetical protein RhiirA1_217056 [Rhizophagus irregularis]